MANIEKYKELYKCQDDVLELIKNNKLDFYLTGGTCLNRFYYEKRYSEDLDFFAIEIIFYLVLGAKIYFLFFPKVTEEKK